MQLVLHLRRSFIMIALISAKRCLAISIKPVWPRLGLIRPLSYSHVHILLASRFRSVNTVIPACAVPVLNNFIFPSALYRCRAMTSRAHLATQSLISVCSLSSFIVVQAHKPSFFLVVLFHRDYYCHRSISYVSIDRR